MSDALPNPLEQLSLETLRKRRSAKWQAFGSEALPLWVAEMDVPLAPPVAATLHRAAELGDTGYPMPHRYAEALAAFAANRWDWAVDPSTIRTVPDVMRGIVEALRLVTDPGDAVIVSSPVYPPFFTYPKTAARRVLESPLDPGGRLNLAGLEETFAREAAASRNAAYLLCNPHNPTGVVHTQEELEQLAALAHRHGVRVIADEIHAPLVLPAEDDDAGSPPPRFTPYLSVDPRAFSLMSASKAWNLAGLKAAALIAGEEATADIRRLPKETSQGPSHLGVLAHVTAYEEGQPWLDSLLEGLARNRRLLSTLLEEHLPQVRWIPPEATYLAWLDFSEVTGLPALSEDVPTPGLESPLHGPAKHLLRQAGLVLTAGHPFGEGGQRHARLNFATSSGILAEAGRRLGAAVL